MQERLSRILMVQRVDRPRAVRDQGPSWPGAPRTVERSDALNYFKDVVVFQFLMFNREKKCTLYRLYTL